MRNDLPTDRIPILYTFKQKNELNSVIAEVTCVAYSTIMSAGALFVDREICKVYDDFDLNNRRNCVGHNHSKKKCAEVFGNNLTCPRCAGNHAERACNSTIFQCANCIEANKYLGKKWNIKHHAYDKKKCDTFKFKWNQVIENTDYPWKLVYPF